MVPAGLNPRPSFKTPPKYTHTRTHAHSYSLLRFCREEECYRLTQRKSACRPVLTQGPSSLWPGQCPTVRLEAACTQCRKCLSGSIFFYAFLFLLLQCNFSSHPCLLLSQVVRNSSFLPILKYIYSFSNFSPQCLFKFCGSLFLLSQSRLGSDHCKSSEPKMSLMQSICNFTLLSLFGMENLLCADVCGIYNTKGYLSHLSLGFIIDSGAHDMFELIACERTVAIKRLTQTDLL